MPSKSQLKKVHDSADYYERQFRALFVRAMKSLQETISISSLANELNTRSASKVELPLRRSEVEKALAKLKPIIVKAYMRGGKLGAEHLTQMLEK